MCSSTFERMSHRVLFLPPPWGLPLYWTGMGEETRRSSSYRWHGLERGRDEMLLWQVTLSGRGWIQCGGGPARALPAGEGFLARIPSDHCYFHRRGDGPWRFLWAIWSGPAVRAIWESLSKTDVRITGAAPSHLSLLQSPLRRRASGLPSTPDEAADAYRLLLDLCRPGAGKGRAAPIAPMPVLPRLERAAARRPSAPVGKDGLAASLRLSRFQLYRALRRETGEGPKDWTARRRIDRACRLLRETGRPVAEVAVAVGLPDANYFARFFRKRTGFSPRDWRRLFAPDAPGA